MLWVWVMFSSLDLIRRNINRAVSDKLVSTLRSYAQEYFVKQLAAPGARHEHKRF